MPLIILAFSDYGLATMLFCPVTYSVEILGRPLVPMTRLSWSWRRWAIEAGYVATTMFCFSVNRLGLHR